MLGPEGREDGVNAQGTMLMISVLFVLSFSACSSQAQSDSWTWLPDGELPLIASSDPGGYAVLVDAVPWSTGWAVGAMVYDETGDARAYLGRCSAADEGVVQWAPLDTAWILYDLAPDPSNDGGMNTDGLLLAGAWQLPLTDSIGVAREGVVQRRMFSSDDPAGILDASFGANGSLILTLEGPYTEIRSMAPSPSGWIVAGMTLDPCCAHREWPFLASVLPDGSIDADFGSGDADDLGGVTIYKLGEPGEPSEAMRHEIGGYFTSVSTLPDGTGYIAGGAYSNTAHYEPLLIKVDAEGAVNDEFGGQMEGQAGWAHWNVDPGVNAWIEGVQPYAEGTWFQVRSHSGGELSETALHAGAAGATGDIESLVTTGEGQLWGDIRTVDSLRMAPSWPPAIQLGPPLESANGLPGESWSSPADFPTGAPDATYAHFTTAFHPTLNRWALFAHRTVGKNWDVVAVFGQLVQPETSPEMWDEFTAPSRNCHFTPMPLRVGQPWSWTARPAGQLVEIIDMTCRLAWHGTTSTVPELPAGPYIVRMAGLPACQVFIRSY